MIRSGSGFIRISQWRPKLHFGRLVGALEKRKDRKIMAKYEKADLRGIGSKEKHLTGKSKRFLISDYKHFPHSVQCRHCGSDYMRYAVDGYCQRCQQKAEHVLREHPRRRNERRQKEANR